MNAADPKPAKSPLRESALAFAKTGIPIFPIKHHGKEPACAHGFKDATTDLAQIDTWWPDGATEEYNIGLCPDDMGWCVIDPDGAEGIANFEKQCTEHGGLPVPTYTVSTPNGGRHYYFKGKLPSTASRLAPKVDTRGVGGYVVAEGSSIRRKDGTLGTYEQFEDHEIQELPAWIAEELAVKEHTSQAAPDDVELDTEANVNRAIAHLKADLAEIGAPVEGNGSDDRTYRMAAAIRGLGISPAKTAELMIDHWSPHFEPDWLERKAENAARYSQNDAGAFAAGKPSETFKGFAEKFAVEPKEFVNDNAVDSEPRPFRPKSFDEFVNEPEPEWLVQDLLEDRKTALLLGDTGDFKSTIATGIAGSLVTGHPVFGKLKVNRTGAVAWIAGEDVASVRPRLLAMECEFGVSFKGKPFYRIDTMFQVGQQSQFDEVVGELERLGPLALIVWDTLSTSIRGQEENSNGVMSAVTGWANDLRDKFGCSVLILHHRPKSAKKGEASSRGGGASNANVDSVILVEREDEELTVELTLPKMRLSSSDAGIRLKGKVHQTGRRKDGTPVKAVAMVMDETGASSAEQDRKERARSIKGWRNKAVAALEWMRVNRMKSCTMRQLYAATARMAEWSVLPNGGKLPLLEFEKLLDRPLTELEAARLDSGTRRLRALVQMRKPGEDGRATGKGPKDGRVRNFGTADIAKLIDDEWVFSPMALAKVNYDGGDDG